MKKQLTRQEAIEFSKSGKWRNMSDKEIVEFQFPQRKLCMPIEVYKKALSNILGTGFMTHELSSDYKPILKKRLINAGINVENGD